jgi:hypothetical protein
LREEGAVLLPAAVPAGILSKLQCAAQRCFEMVESSRMLPEGYRFNRFAHSVVLTALSDFGCDPEDLTAPLSATSIGRLCSAAMPGEWICAMNQSWVRKKYPAQLVPDSAYHQQDWHQDGALGVTFPAQAGEVIPMTQLLTCWIPLSHCGENNPGLEFVRRPLSSLLHYTELDDSALRNRFASHEFWAPILAPGDALVFLNGTLHRTYAHAGMQFPRLSMEYRLFPQTKVRTFADV